MDNKWQDLLLFDKQEMIRRIGDDADLLHALLQSAKKTMPEYIAEIASAVAAGNSEQAKQAAHAVKGAAANLSFCRLQEAAKEMESAAKEQTGDMAQKLAFVQQEWQSIQNEWSSLES